MISLPPVPAELRAYLVARASGGATPRAMRIAAVKSITSRLQELAPGHSVEFRVPPVAAIQMVEGVNHRRGTPPALVQLSVDTCIDLAIGQLTWENGIAAGLIQASGERSDLRELFPLFQP